MKKTLIAALTLAVAAGPARADEPAPFAVTPGFKVEANPAKAAKDKCACGADCQCPPGKCPSCPPAAPDNPLWFAVRVSVSHGDSSASGSGTPIYSEDGKTLVLTNAHVVPEHDRGRPITVHTVYGKSYPATYVDGSKVVNTGPNTINVLGSDLCLLSVDADLGAVTVAADVPPPGAYVYQWGYGGSANGQPVARGGRVLHTDHRTSSGDAILYSSLPSVSGDSGSGLFNTKGELVGVTWGGNGNDSNAVPLASVRSFFVRPAVKALFPRLAERVESKRAAAVAAAAAAGAAAAAAKPPAERPAFNPPPAAPAAPPRNSLAADGWTYDAARGVWRKQSGGASNCPNGQCPVQQPVGRRR